MQTTVQPRSLATPDDLRTPDTGVSITRRLRRSAGLPSGRALVGALLVVASVLGVVAAYRQATTLDTIEWVVFARPVEAGTVLTVDDLALAAADLVGATEERSFRDPDDVIGQRVLVSVERGELVSRSIVSDSLDTTATSGRLIGLTLDSDLALGGRLAPGDRVDVYALADGRDGPAVVLERNALVASVGDESSASIGRDAAVRLTLAVDSEDAALAIVTAHSTTGVTLVKAVEAR